MLADLIPFMTSTVQHWYPPKRDIYGAVVDVDHGTSFHSARVTYTPGVVLGGASNRDMKDQAATIWLIDHPRKVSIGDTFTLSSGEMMLAVALQCRDLTGGRLTKVFVK